VRCTSLCLREGLVKWPGGRLASTLTALLARYGYWLTGVNPCRVLFHATCQLLMPHFVGANAERTGLSVRTYRNGPRPWRHLKSIRPPRRVPSPTPTSTCSVAAPTAHWSSRETTGALKKRRATHSASQPARRTRQTWKFASMMSSDWSGTACRGNRCARRSGSCWSAVTCGHSPAPSTSRRYQIAPQPLDCKKKPQRHRNVRRHRSLSHHPHRTKMLASRSVIPHTRRQNVEP